MQLSHNHQNILPYLLNSFQVHKAISSATLPLSESTFKLFHKHLAISSTQRFRFKMSSGGHEITMPETYEEKDKDMFRKLQEKKTQPSNEQGQSSDQVTKIQRVPDLMKAEKKEYWEKYFVPKAIAIGPIHANSNNLSLSEDLKWTWAAQYLDGLKEENIFNKIRGEIDSLMGHFDETCLDRDAIGASRDEDVPGTLARMLFVDGCAMLQFIYSFVWDDDFGKHLKIKAAQADVVQQDLLLLENQIPFKVLQIIMEEGKNKQQKEREKQQKEFDSDFEKLTKMETAVEMFIHMSNMSTALRPEISLKFDDAVHLLDLLRQSLLDDPHSAGSDDNPPFNSLLSFVKFSVLVIFKLPLYVLRFLVCLVAIMVVIFFSIISLLIDFLKYREVSLYMFSMLIEKVVYLCSIGVCGLESPKSVVTRRSFRNVQELKAAGIELKPSKSRCLKEVSFRSGLFGGCLRLCPILVDKSTAGKLLNLIAYEMCPDYHCKTSDGGKSYDYRISSYLSFLDSLIDNEQDVKDLRAANILRHRLSCDADVAELFNNISPISMADDAYGNVNSEIQEYYEWKLRIWITEFRQAHLSSPWRLLALVAAAAALALTAVQTRFTINPK